MNFVKDLSSKKLSLKKKVEAKKNRNTFAEFGQKNHIYCILDH